MASILPTTPVFVLVHGAFHGGWCWRRVADRLTKAGVRVFAPTLTGLGERAHLLAPNVDFNMFVDDIAGVIVVEELQDIVLVGHSFGGAVISGVVDRLPKRIRQLVYLDAIVPRNGQSAISQLSPDVAAARLRSAQQSGGLGFPVPAGDIFGLPRGPDRDWVARHITPHPVASYTQPIMLNGAVGRGRPRVYIRCTAPIYSAVQPSYERILNDPGWELIDLATSHDAMVTAPAELAEMLSKYISP